MDPYHQYGRWPSPPAPRRSGRPAAQRIAPRTVAADTRELVARMKAPGADAPLRDVTKALYAAPLGRHGFRDVPSTLVNLRAHREHFTEVSA